MKYLVTSALPYANGPIHLGHIAGAYLPGDVFVRYLRNSGEDVIYVCGTDEHGVPITINAESRNISPEDVIKENHESIKNAFNKIGMSFDIFSGTHNDTHKKLSQEFFTQCYEHGYISEKNVDQFFCEHDNMFLPDRYVEGICPLCGAKGARGDQCDKCGNAINALDLKEPYCKVCGKTPVIKTSKHWFLDLNKFQDKLQTWLAAKKSWKPNVKAFCEQWFERGLEPRGITRDIKWGVPVPLEGAEGKVLYVWFDAPIGYASFTKELFEKKGMDKDEWKSWWKGGKDVKLYHFIGKDNIVFHSIIWPAMLMAQESDWKLPDEIPANEFLNLEGNKFSTSNNYAIWVNDFLDEFSADSLRYYLALIAPETKDSDFSYKGFQAANNGELAGIYGNFVNRTLAFIGRFFEGKLDGEFEYDKETDNTLWSEIEKEITIIKENYKTCKVRDNVFHIMEIGRIANRYFDTMKPWALRKENKARCKAVLLNCVNIIDTIATISEPIIPFTSRKVKKMLNLEENFSFAKLGKQTIMEGHQFGETEILFTMIDDKTITRKKSELGL